MSIKSGWSGLASCFPFFLFLPAPLPSTNPSSRTTVESLRERERERESAMEDDCSTGQLKRAELTEASTPTISKRPRLDVLEESPLLLPSSDSLEKIDVPSASGAKSDPSASFTSVIGNNYCVFLSFRGPDTRNGFVDHLYHRLQDVGLPFHPNFVFRDDKDLRVGEKIAEKLISAINHSKVSIPVISENYAASEWCLRELIQIMKCVERGEQKVFPVLYKVKPSEVRELKGAFGAAFKSSMHLFEKDVKQQGPEALIKAVASTIYESEKIANGREAELITELVRVIMDEQQHDFLPPLPGNLVGIDDRVAEVMKLADTDPSDIRIIGICGIGGIGKTTLATNIYNKLAKKFECRSFLMDIRGTIDRKGMEHIQSLLLSDITKNHESRVRDSMRGIGKIRLSCEKKKVLILLDDVGHRDHIDKLIGGCNFELGSRIIITCQDKALLNSEYRSYELQELNSIDSVLLFSLYAFEAKQPPTDFTILSSHIVATTGGLPLALEIIGSFLKRKEKIIWIETLEKLRKVPHTDVQKKLKISYDSLGNQEQRMFLDIACFFIGIDKRIVTYLWKDLDLYPASGLKRMIELSLIKYGDNNELRMHDQLRDLGRHIALSAAKEPWDWRRLWGKEAMKVLRCENDNENIEALHLDEKGSREFMERGSFTKMPNLKFLHLNAVDFAGEFEGPLTELRWLKWEGCCDSLEMTNFHLEKLVILDLSSFHYDRGSGISENWRGWSSIKMERLKVLNLSWCSELKSNPNLSACENLEWLILEGCANLKEINPSIQYAKRLLLLNLRGCISLKMLPEQLSELEHLEELVVDKTQIKKIPSCIGSLKKLKRLSAQGDWPSKHLSLKKIPSSIGKLGELVELNLSYTRIKELPESIGKLNKLKILKIQGCEIERIPSSIGRLQSLQELDASGCRNLEGQILLDKGGLSSLKILDLNSTKIPGLPENLDQLSSLERLNLISGWGELESLPKPPFSLKFLGLTYRSKELPSLSHLKHLQTLSLYECMSLQSIPSLSHLKHLQVLKLVRCESLQSIPLLSHLKHLQELYLDSCVSLQEIPELPSCIRKFHVGNCPKVERFPNLSDLEFLSKLKLVNCNGLKKLDGLGSLKSLRLLHLRLSFAESVDHLHVIEGLEKLVFLENVDISRRKHIQVLDLSKSEHLKWLDVTDCKSLVEIRSPSKFFGWFERSGCESLKKLPDLFIEESNNEKLTEDYEESSDSTEEDYEESSDSTEEDYEEYILWRRIMKNIQILWRMTKICFGDR